MDKHARELIEASRVIGGAFEHPHWATAGLVAAIEYTGQRVGELTVNELVGLIQAQDQRITKILTGTTPVAGHQNHEEECHVRSI